MNQILLRMVLNSLLDTYKSKGIEAVERMLTIPEKDLAKIVGKDNLEEAKKLRSEFSKAGAKFVVGLINLKN